MFGERSTLSLAEVPEIPTDEMGKNIIGIRNNFIVGVGSDYEMAEVSWCSIFGDVSYFFVHRL